MNKEENFVITISRQFGTGGHEIGAELARRLGVKLLDKQILNAVAGTQSIMDRSTIRPVVSCSVHSVRPSARLRKKSRVSLLDVVVSTSLPTILTA